MRVIPSFRVKEFTEAGRRRNLHTYMPIQSRTFSTAYGNSIQGRKKDEHESQETHHTSLVFFHSDKYARLVGGLWKQHKYRQFSSITYSYRSY
ncbi:MAG: hypothetical protein ACJ8BW_22450, partial [Ktedonobacteraceae bacterium]